MLKKIVQVTAFLFEMMFDSKKFVQPAYNYEVRQKNFTKRFGADVPDHKVFQLIFAFFFWLYLLTL